MNALHTLLATLAAAAALAAAPAAQAAGSADAGKAKAAVCAGCHGPDGNSANDMWPRLAGQLPQYISKQLHDFKDGLRRNDQMTPMAAPLNDQDIEDLAAWFSSQKAAGSDTKGARWAVGRDLYLHGKGRPDIVPACVGCHGPGGIGKADWAGAMSRAPVVLAPAIGSQHKAYTLRQLTAYKAGARGNDLSHVMRDVAGRLTDDEIAALAEYVATLGR